MAYDFMKEVEESGEYESVYRFNDRVFSAFNQNEYRKIYDIFVDDHYVCSFNTYDECKFFAEQIIK